MEPNLSQPVTSQATLYQTLEPTANPTIISEAPADVTTDSSSGSWMKWGILGFIILIIIIVIIVVIWWCCSSNNDTSCDKPKTCPRRPRGTVPDIDRNAANRTVALLELTGNGWVELDRSIASLLEVYNSERPANQHVIILDTQSDIEQTKTLWMKSVQDGHRKFIGASRSSVLAELQPLINSRPDTVFISVGSTAPSLAQRDNIFRLTKDDNFLLPQAPHFLSKRYDYVHILEQEGSIWSRELTQLMSDSLRANGTRVGVTRIVGPVTTPGPTQMNGTGMGTRSTTRSTLANTVSDDLVANGEQLNDHLAKCVPSESNIAFLSIIEANMGQYVYSLIDDAPWAHFQHYGFDTLALYPFQGKAASAARKTKLQVVCYHPEGTLESEAVLRQSGMNVIQPLAPSAYDAAVALERIGLNTDTLEEYFLENRGITGLLTVNEKNDRITNPYILWDYDNGQWSPVRIFGHAIPYGDYFGFFGADLPTDESGPVDPEDDSYDGDYYYSRCEERDDDCDDHWSSRDSDRPVDSDRDRKWERKESQRPYSPVYQKSSRSDGHSSDGYRSYESEISNRDEHWSNREY